MRKSSRQRILLILRALVSLGIGLGIYGALILLPTFVITGGLDWTRGWLFLVLYAGSSLLMGTWLYIIDPGLLTERVRLSFGQNARDAAASVFLFVLVLIWCVLIPIDVQLMHLLPELPGQLGQWLGVGLYGAGFAMFIWTFEHNTFAAPIVKTQETRGQWVVDTGPYAFVRHPMYAGMFPYFAGAALFLGSSAMALAVVPMFILALLPRILTEEATLAEELDEYAGYMDDVRWRLIPRVF